jgi:hypothetical protein
MQSAAKHIHWSIINVLLEEGVSTDDERPIWYAIAFENLSMVKFVIARGVRVDGVLYRKCLTKFENKHYHNLRTFANTSMMPVIFYFVTKLVEERPVFPEGKLDRLAHLVEDVGDSKFWSGKV